MISYEGRSPELLIIVEKKQFISLVNHIAECVYLYTAISGAP